MFNPIEKLSEAGESLVSGVGEFASETVGGVQSIARDPIGAVFGATDIGEPEGSDGGSSNWAAWGHEEIRSMLDDSVEPADIHAGASEWQEKGRAAEHIVTSLVTDLNRIVPGGWRGESADAAIRSLEPVNAWSVELSEAVGHTAQLMAVSGSAADQAKTTVPQPVSHSWGRTAASGILAGPAGMFVDAVAQDRAQEQARAEAVRLMYSVYSAPINESRVAVPTYPQLVDPTLQPPEQAPISGPSPRSGQFGPGMPGGGGMPGGAGVPGGGGVPHGGAPGGYTPYQPPAGTGLQDGVPPSPDSRVPSGPSPIDEPRRPIGGGPPATPGGAPIMTPIVGGGLGGDAQRAHRGVGGARFGGGGGGGVGGGRVGGGAGFGPRGSGGVAAGAAGEGRFGAGPGGVAGAAGRGGAGGAPLAAMGAGRGQGGEDTEHRRPSYLIEMDDVFGDGRKVAPPVIGEDPPEYYG